MANNNLDTDDKRFEFSRRNDLHFRSCPYVNCIRETVNDLYQEMLEPWKALHAKIRDPDYKYKQTLLEHIEIIILDLYVCWHSSPDRFIGYSRNHGEFRKNGSYYDGFNDKPFLSKSAFPEVIDTLAELDYVDNYKAQAGREGMSSRMKATDKLIRFLESYEINPAAISRSENEQVIKLNSEKTNGKKRKIWYRDRDHQDANITRMRENLEKINAYLQDQFLSIDISEEDLTEINRRLRGNRRQTLQAVDFTRKRLYRIFSEGSFDYGGRFYGGWWQSIPSEFRRHIKIQNVSTDECDFSTLHPRILYAQETGEALPDDDDAYDISAYGWPGGNKDKAFRGYCKKAFQQLVNSSETMRDPSRWEALSVPDLDNEDFDDERNGGDKESNKQAFMKRYERPYTDLLNDMYDKHKTIKRWFFSDGWKELQRTESDIAERIMLDMYERDVAVLPIHDSFIVRRGFGRELIEAMNKYFEEIVGVTTKIDTDFGAYRDGYDRNQDSQKVINGNDCWPEIDAYKHTLSDKQLSDWNKIHGLNGVN
jgi:hypothetical protein